MHRGRSKVTSMPSLPSRRKRGCGVRAALLALWTAGGAGAQEESAPEMADPVLREVHVETEDVFAEDSGNLLYWFANTFHATTHPEVVRRELFFAPGDTVRDEQIAELARNLRRLNLFGEVDAALEDQGDGTADLRLRTRDRFSLLVSASASSVGGVQSYGGILGETNLFGTGKRLTVSARREDEDDRFTLRYQDPQLFGTWHTASVAVGDATEGAFGFLDVRRPFRHLEDPWSYGLRIGFEGRDIDYYARGESIAYLPEQSELASFYVARGFGPRDLRASLGFDFRLESITLDALSGSRPDYVEVPGDTRELQIAGSFGLDWNDAFVVARRIDSIDYDEDLRLGVSTGFRAGVAVRDEEGVGTALQPIVSFTTRAAVSPIESSYLTFESDVGGRTESSLLRAWGGDAALHGFALALPGQTLAFSARAARAFSEQGIRPQLTLGEDNGLRGYPARYFAADRLAVLNFEDRIDVGIELWSIHVGFVAFADVGFIPDEETGRSFGDPLRSVGLGLRFASSELFGGGVFRLDVARPLDDVPGEDFGITVSGGAGQVFGFFGNAAELVAEFAGVGR